jgi:hypothetical protein
VNVQEMICGEAVEFNIATPWQFTNEQLRKTGLQVSFMIAGVGVSLMMVTPSSTAEASMGENRPEL